MFCPKCGNEIKDNSTVCDKCNFNIKTNQQLEDIKYIEKENQNTMNTNIDKNEQLSELKKIDNHPLAVEKLHKSSDNKMNIVKAILFSLIAIFILVMSFIAARQIAQGGLKIMDIQSVGGKTLEEAYYSSLGDVYQGYATVVRIIGMFFASVLVWLGLKK